LAQHIEGAAPVDLASQPLEKPRTDVVAVKLPQLVPFHGLRGADEIEHVLGEQAESAIVVSGRASLVSPGNLIALAEDRCVPRGRTLAFDERGFDGGFETGFGDFRLSSRRCSYRVVF